MSALAPVLQAFFTDRLVRQRRASPRTVSEYRDTWRLLLGFAASRLGKAPSALDFVDVDAPLISAFLDPFEHDRGNAVSTRNARPAATHSLFRYAAFEHPEHAASIARGLAMPAKRFERSLVTFLTEMEVAALLAVPDAETWTGRRDRTLLLVAVQTGLRISELIGLRCGDVHLGPGARVACHGKGRKERVTPLTAATVAVLRAWLAERDGLSGAPVFPARTGGRLSRDAVEHRLTHPSRRAAVACPSLAAKTVTAQVLRHTAAMRQLEAGVDTTVIALWLGYERVDTTAIYIHAHLGITERALAPTRPPTVKPGRHRPPDTLLAFLEGL